MNPFLNHDGGGLNITDDLTRHLKIDSLVSDNPAAGLTGAKHRRGMNVSFHNPLITNDQIARCGFDFTFEMPINFYQPAKYQLSLKLDPFSDKRIDLIVPLSLPLLI